MRVEYEKLHKSVLAMVREDAVCRRLMTVPGVGPLVAMTYKSAIDDPSRFTKSKAAGALFGLTPKKYQSGELTCRSCGAPFPNRKGRIRPQILPAAKCWARPEMGTSAGFIVRKTNQ